RWSTVLPAAREPWDRRLLEASAKLDNGARLLGAGEAERAIAMIREATAAFGSTWAEYVEGAERAARRDAKSALAAWDSEFAALAGQGMAEPGEVALARAQLNTPVSDTALDDRTLAPLRATEALLTEATARLREEHVAYD